MDRFVDQKRAEGFDQGEGRFTVDLLKAQEKLSRFQLPEAWAYILKLVQWAVTAEPTQIQIEVKSGFVSVSHDGKPTTSEELKQGLRSPLEVKDRSLSCLLVALGGVVRLTPTNLVVRNCDTPTVLAGADSGPSSGLASQVWVAGIQRKRFQRSKLLGDYFFRFYQSTDAQGTIQSLVLDSTGWRRPEFGMVRQLCHLCDIPIRLNGVLINRPVLGTPNRYAGDTPIDLAATADKGADRARVILNTGRTPGGMLTASARFCTAQTDWLELDPGADSPNTLAEIPRQRMGTFWAIGLTLGLASRLAARGEVKQEFEVDPSCRSLVPGFTYRGFPTRTIWVAYLNYPSAYGLGKARLKWHLDGVIISHQILPDLPDSTVIFADAQGLKTDLSGFWLVQDSAFQERIDWIKRWMPSV